MSRPTENRKDKTIKVRISEDLYDRLKDKNMSEIVRNALEDSFVGTKKGFVPTKNLKSDGFVPTKSKEEKVLYPQNDNYVPTKLQPVLKDTLDMVRLSVGEDNMISFVNDLHDRLESGELQIVDGKLKLGYHEIFEVLNSGEVRGWLKPVWTACEEKGRTNIEGLKAVFKHGAKLATEDIYGDRQ